MTSKIIIGIAGKMASGKGTVASFFTDTYKAKRLGSSKPLRVVLDQFYLPQKRENLQKLSTLLRQGFGEDVLINRVLHEIHDLKDRYVVFEGIRRVIDVDSLKRLPNFIFLYVDLDQKERYRRYVLRNENPGDGEMSYEDFQKEDSAEPEQEIESLKEKADYCILSTSEPAQFRQELTELFQKILS